MRSSLRACPVAGLALLALLGCSSAPPPPAAAAKAAAKNPCDTADVLRGKVKHLREMGRLERASKAIEKADALCVDTAPESWAAHVAILAELGRTTEAKALASLIETSPRAPAAAQHAIAAARELIDRQERRLAEPSKAKVDKAKAEAKKLLREGEIAEAAGDAKKALDRFRRSQDEWPSFLALGGAGMAAKKLGDSVEAQRLFDRAIVELEKASGKTLDIDVPNDFTGSVISVAWAPSGFRLAVAHGEGVSILSTVDFRERVRLVDLGKPRAVAFSSDGALVVTGSDDRGVRIWDAATGALLQTFKEHTGEVTSVAFAPSGKLLASGAKDATVRVWDLTKNVILRVFTDHTSDVNSVAFSPDSKRLVSGSADNTVRMWDLAHDGQIIRALDEHTLYVTAVAFSPDSKLLATGSWDRTVRIWDANVKTIEAQPKYESNKAINDHSDRVTTVAFAPKGLQLASGSWDNTVRTWNPISGKPVDTFKGHTQWVTSLSFSPDGKQLASGSWDTTVRVWDTDKSSSTPLQTLKEIADRVVLAAFSPDGKQIAASGPDRVVRMWNPAAKTFARGVYQDYVGRLKADTLSPDRGFRVSTTMAGLLSLLRAQDSTRLAVLRTLEGKEGGYVLASDGHIDFAGPDACAAHALPLCRVGSVSLPFDFCEDRFYSPGLLGKLLAHDDSYADPDAEYPLMECPAK
jgi:WD40 repeat protein